MRKHVVKEESGTGKLDTDTGELRGGRLRGSEEYIIKRDWMRIWGRGLNITMLKSKMQK